MEKEGIFTGELLLQFLNQGGYKQGIFCIKTERQLYKVEEFLFRSDFPDVYDMIPNFFPTFLKAVRTISRCSSVWVAM